MSEKLLTPEQFAWLMSLPADHAERIAWSGRPEFESMRALYEQFQASPTGDADRDLREGVIALERRFRADFDTEPRVIASEARPSAARGRAARSWWSVLPRPAFAVAAALIMTIGGMWLWSRPRLSAVRGVGDAPVILETRHLAEALEIRWTPVTGAESYRLSFVDQTMREVAAVESWRDTRYLLKPSALPPGLEHGAEVILQVQPVRAGATAGAAGTRSIRVP